MNTVEINYNIPQYKIQVTKESNPGYEPIKISNSADFAEKCRGFIDTLLFQEQMIIIALNYGYKIIGYHVLGKGGVSFSPVDLKIMFMFLLNVPSCSAFAITHNHPSGNRIPSEEDKKITQMAKNAGKMFELNLLDHIIVTENNYYSFADEGIL